MAYTKISDTVAEKTQTAETKVRISLDQKMREKSALEKRLAEVNRDITELRALGLKTLAELRAEATEK